MHIYHSSFLQSTKIWHITNISQTLNGCLAAHWNSKIGVSPLTPLPPLPSLFWFFYLIWNVLCFTFFAYSLTLSFPGKEIISGRYLNKRKMKMKINTISGLLRDFRPGGKWKCFHFLHFQKRGHQKGDIQFQSERGGVTKRGYNFRLSKAYNLPSSG